MRALNNFKNEKFIFFFVILSLSALLFITNKYISINESIVSGFSDINHYYKIALCGNSLSFSSLKDIIIPEHFAERWLPNFVIGVIAKVLNIKILFLYRFSILFIYLFIIIHLYKTSYYIYSKLCYLFLLILNPYTFRSYFFTGVSINDCLFLLSNYLLVISLNKKNYFAGVLLAIILGSISRQTVIFFIPIFFLSYYFKKITKKDFYRFSIMIILILSMNKLFVTFFFQPMPNTTILHIYGLFIWLFQDPSIKDLYPFVTRFIFFLILLSPILLIKFSNSNFIFYLICTLFLIAQPLLAGPVITNAGGLRLFAFSLPFLCFPILNNYQNKISSFLFILFLFLDSFHHKYTLLNSKLFYFYVVFAILVICFILAFKYNWLNNFRSFINKNLR